MIRRNLAGALAWLCLCATFSSSCRNKGASGSAADAAAPPAPAADPAAPESQPATSVDLINILNACEVHHRGLSLDVGTRSVDYLRGFSTGPFVDIVNVDREGATFGRVRTRAVAYEFRLDEPQEGLFLSMRVHGGLSRLVSAQLDDKRLGSLRLSQDETKVVSFPPVSGAVAAGRHRLVLRFAGKLRGPEDSYAELDWIRLAVTDPVAATYSAPTLRDIVTEDVVLGNQPKRSIVLRAPSTVRCPIRVAPSSELRVALGFWGSGRGTAQLRVASDGEQPVTLAERKVEGGAAAAWTPIQADLSAYAGRMIELELRVLETTRGGRIAFGDAALASKEPPARERPSTHTAVVVIGSALGLRQVPPWGPTGAQSALGELSRGSVAFAAYRAPSSVPGAVVASILSGLSPTLHGLQDPGARLPQAVHTLSEIVKESSGRTAMFTGVPTTFEAFGFNTGWDRYEMISPVKDAPAHEPYRLAAQWIDAEFASEEATRRLLVLHVRGAHPPWDISREEMGKLKPDDYGGPIDARRGAITLANVRARKQRSQRRLSDEDWTRLHELSLAALVKQNQGLWQLIGALKKAGAWNDALFIFVGDVAAGDAPELPYEPAGPLGEDRLLVPLLVKFPSGQFAGKETATAVTSIDLSRTILDALRLKVPDQLAGIDLFDAAVGHEPLFGRALVATLGNHYSTRAGNWLLSGELGKVPRLCQLDVDPACVNDVFDRRPIAARALWRWTFDAETAPETGAREHAREPASIDGETAAALTVWGDL